MHANVESIENRDKCNTLPLSACLWPLGKYDPMKNVIVDQGQRHSMGRPRVVHLSSIVIG